MSWKGMLLWTFDQIYKVSMYNAALVGIGRPTVKVLGIRKDAANKLATHLIDPDAR